MLSMKERKNFALEFFLCLDFIDFPRAGEILPTRCLFAFHQQFVMDFFSAWDSQFSSHYIDDSWACFYVSLSRLGFFFAFSVCFLYQFSSPPSKPAFFRGEMISAEVVILFASVFGRIRYLRVY